MLWEGIKMTELSVNNYDISKYLGSTSLDDGKLDETELLEAINSYNEANEDNPITGSLKITYSSSDFTLDESITDKDINGASASITDSSNSAQSGSIEDQLADVGIGVLTSSSGELIIYASTDEELTKVQDILSGKGMSYDVTATSKSESEIQEHLDSLIDLNSDVVGKGSGDEYENMIADSIMQMSFYDEVEGKDDTYSINDLDVIDEFKTWLETETVEEASTDIEVEDVAKTSSSSNGKDAIDISKATIVGINEDVSGWDVKYDLEMDLSNGITFNQELTSEVAAKDTFAGDALAGNAWVFWYGDDGKLYGSTFEWFGENQKTKFAESLEGGIDETNDDIPAWAPKSGETLYWCASGLCRMGESNTPVRTNVVEAKWP